MARCMPLIDAGPLRRRDPLSAARSGQPGERTHGARRISRPTPRRPARQLAIRPARRRQVRCPGRPRCTCQGGFQPGHVYELSYEATGAVVAGVGFAAVRDLASAVKHGRPARLRRAMPMRSAIRRMGATSGSSSTRGSTPTSRERASSTASSPISRDPPAARDFNGRFAKPSGLAYFTASLFPYLDLDQTDPVTGRVDGIQMHLAPEQRPKIFYTNSSTEYWGGGRAAALTHTTLDGRSDVAAAGRMSASISSPARSTSARRHSTPRRARAAEAQRQRLHLGDARAAGCAGSLGAQRRGAAAEHSPDAGGRQPGALAEDPLSDDPRRALPKTIPAGYRADLAGPHDAHRLPMLVPQVDRDGNEVAGIRLPNVAVPLATYTGWYFRSPAMGQPDELLPLTGYAIPFPATRADRQRTARSPPLHRGALRQPRALSQLWSPTRPARLVKAALHAGRRSPARVDQALANWDELVRGSSLAGQTGPARAASWPTPLVQAQHAVDDPVLGAARLEPRADDLEGQVVRGLVGVDVAGVGAAVGQRHHHQPAGRRLLPQARGDLAVDLAVDGGEIDVADAQQADPEVDRRAVLVRRQRALARRRVEAVAARAGELLPAQTDARPRRRGAASGCASHRWPTRRSARPPGVAISPVCASAAL